MTGRNVSRHVKGHSSPHTWHKKILVAMQDPAVAILSATMENLATDGLGEVKVADRSTVFFKKLPADVSEETLAKYEVQREAYLYAFNELDKAIISERVIQ